MVLFCAVCAKWRKATSVLSEQCLLEKSHCLCVKMQIISSENLNHVSLWWTQRLFSSRICLSNISAVLFQQATDSNVKVSLPKYFGEKLREINARCQITNTNNVCNSNNKCITSPTKRIIHSLFYNPRFSTIDAMLQVRKTYLKLRLTCTEYTEQLYETKNIYFIIFHCLKWK